MKREPDEVLGRNVVGIHLKKSRRAVELLRSEAADIERLFEPLV